MRTVATLPHALRDVPLPSDLQAQLAALPQYEPSTARCLRCGALLGLGWLALLLTLLLAAPLLPSPWVSPGGERTAPGRPTALTALAPQVAHARTLAPRQRATAATAVHAAVHAAVLPSRSGSRVWRPTAAGGRAGRPVATVMGHLSAIQTAAITV